MAAMDFQVSDARKLVPGLAAIGFYAAHVLQWVKLRKPENALWACHFGCLLVGIGWLGKWPAANAIGLMWLLPGIVFWALYLAGGGLFLWTSCLTHIGGSMAGLWGAAVLGVPVGAWWKAGLAYAVLIALSRCVSRASENVNFSVQVWRGWGARFPSYARYLAGLLLGSFVLFLAIERLLCRIFPAAG